MQNPTMMATVLSDLRNAGGMMNLPLRKITSLSAAYSLQEDASRELSESCRGYALTGTSEKSRRFLGLECPIYSLLTDSDILDHAKTRS